MTWRLEPARRAGVPLLIGLAGPSSSGKTFSALRLATGIQSVAGGEIALLDTENGRALQYAGRFKFQHMAFAAPFNARRYLDALRFLANQSTVRIIVVDSISHEHEGPGGHLAMHEAELDRLAGSDLAKRERMTFLAWAKPAAERRALLNGLQQLDRHVILCLRAKEKIRLEKQGGKTVMVEAGFQPIAGAEFPYELQAMAVLPPRSGGTPDWGAEAAKLNSDMRGLFPADGEPLDEATGTRLAHWARGDDVAQPARGIAFPTVKTWGNLSDYSRQFLAGASPEQARAWRDHFAARLDMGKQSPKAAVREMVGELLELHDKATSQEAASGS